MIFKVILWFVGDKVSILKGKNIYGMYPMTRQWPKNAEKLPRKVLWRCRMYKRTSELQLLRKFNIVVNNLKRNVSYLFLEPFCTIYYYKIYIMDIPIR